MFDWINCLLVLMSLFRIKISPLVILSNPAHRRKKVVFPELSGPTNILILPFSAVKFMFFSATTSSLPDWTNILLTFLASITLFKFILLYFE